MAKGLNDFIKENASEGAKQFKSGTGAALGAVFMAEDLKNLATGEQRLKSIWNIVKNIVFAKPVMAAAFAGMFSGLGKGIKTILKDTGSLEAALNKLSKIQGLQKVFAPFVGGAEQAKRKVAQLINLASSRDLSLDSVVTASKNLMVMSKGAIGSARDLDKLAEVANLTGESIEDLADVTGRFYQTLENGAAIDGAADEMRSLNMISRQAADELKRLQQSGATNGQIFEKMQEQMESFKAGLSGVSPGVDAALKSYESAQKKMAESFGSPWVEEDIERTKNYAAAMNSLAPIIQSISGFFHNLYGGFSTFVSSITKAVAGSVLFEAAVKVLVVAFTALSAALSAVGSWNLVKWMAEGAKAAASSQMAVTRFSLTIQRLTGSLKAAQIAGMALSATLRVISVVLAVTGILAMISLIASAASAIKEFLDSASKARKEMADFNAELAKSSSAMSKQISEVETLAQMHDLLAQAIRESVEAEEEYQQAKQSGDKKEIEKARLKREAKNQSVSEASNRAVAGGFMPEGDVVDHMVRRAEAATAARNQDFEQRFSAASPEGQAAMRQEKIDRLARDYGDASSGAKAAADYSTKSKEADLRVEVAKENLRRMRAGLKYDESPKGVMVELADAETARDNIGKDAPKSSSAYAKYKYRVTKDASWLVRARIAEKREQSAESIGSELSAERAAQKAAQISLGETYAQQGSQADIAGLESEGNQRSRDARRLRIKELDRRIGVARSKGNRAEMNDLSLEKQQLIREGAMQERDLAISDVQRTAGLQLGEAELRGDSKGARRIRNRMAALDAFKSNLDAGMSREEAQNMAMRTMNQSMAIQARERFISAQGVTVADSLASIGGGGNVATSYATMEDLAEEQVDLLKDLKTSLDVIEMAVDNAKAIALE